MTVSYGTFSCTLEGFEDPFGTMREMAEYFRDLAAQDRFFGAEPPQPDVDTLHRIAEQTVQQRITSDHVSKDNLVLRQEAAEPSPQPQAAVPQDVQPQPAAPKAPDAGAPSPLASAVAAMPAAAEVLTPGSADSVAEKLQRIRSVVRGEAKPVLDYSEDEHANDFMARAGRTVSRPIARVVSDDYYDDMQDHTTGDKSDGESEEEGDDSTALLKSQDDAGFQEVERLAADSNLAQEDEHFEDEDVLSLDADGKLEDHSFDASDDGFEDEALPDDQPLVERNRVEVDEMSQEELAAANTTPEPEVLIIETQEEPLPEATEALKRDVAELNTADDEEESEEEEELPPEDSMMSGAFRDFREKFVNGEDPEDNEFAFAGEEDAGESDPSEAVEDIAEEGAEEIQEVAEDTTSVAQDAVNEEVELNVARAAKQARRDALTEDEDTALERLMNATSSRLEDTEGSVRRASIAHLKAAVAATKADSSLVEAAAAKEAQEIDQYREDLARVVRPGKNRADAADGTPNAGQPSPLVLVSEQRIDESEIEDDVRPRRVSGSQNGAAISESSVQATADGVADFEDDTNIFAESETESFAAYVTRHDANELPDLLEAAAAHYCFVEGIEQFTRPMLMRKISSISPEHELSREDGLRSFGTLLREGKIVKDEDGKFVIATTSRFMQEERYAG